MKLEELLTTNTDFSHLSGMMKEAAEKAALEKKEILLRVLVKTHQKLHSMLEAQVKQLRQLRKQERECLAKLEAMNTASKYFEQTGNPLPFYSIVGVYCAENFCRSVGVDIPAQDDEIWKVK